MDALSELSGFGDGDVLVTAPTADGELLTRTMLWAREGFELLLLLLLLLLLALFDTIGPVALIGLCESCRCETDSRERNDNKFIRLKRTKLFCQTERERQEK